MSAEITDPDGVTWRVRRRWYPWRRALSLRDLLSSSPSETTSPSDTTADAESEASADDGGSDLPRNVVLKVLFVVLAAIVWVVYGAGKVLFYTVVVLLFVVGSLLEFAVALAVMPIVLFLRLLGQSRWPVEIGRAGKHFATRHAADFASAGELRDELRADIERGALPADQQASAA